MIPLYGQLLFYVEEAKMTGCVWARVKESLSTAHICVCHDGVGHEPLKAVS